jgi:hypothetical protein
MVGVPQLLGQGHGRRHEDVFVGYPRDSPGEKP